MNNISEAKICPITDKPCLHFGTCGVRAIKCWLKTTSEPDYGHRDSQG